MVPVESGADLKKSEAKEYQLIKLSFEKSRGNTLPVSTATNDKRSHRVVRNAWK